VDDVTITVLGIVLAAQMTWLVRLHISMGKTIERMGDFIPREEIRQRRSEIDARFGELKRDFHKDTEALERRADKQFEELKQYLIRIESLVQSKADKQ